LGAVNLAFEPMGPNTLLRTHAPTPYFTHVGSVQNRCPLLRVRAGDWESFVLHRWGPKWVGEQAPLGPKLLSKLTPPQGE